MVLSSQRVDLKDALYNAVKAKDREETANPLVLDGQKLIPSVTRVFSKSRDMYVYLQAYEQEAQASTADRLREFLPRAKESVRNSAHGGDGGNE